MHPIVKTMFCLSMCLLVSAAKHHVGTPMPYHQYLAHPYTEKLPAAASRSMAALASSGSFKDTDSNEGARTFVNEREQMLANAMVLFQHNAVPILLVTGVVLVTVWTFFEQNQASVGLETKQLPLPEPLVPATTESPNPTELTPTPVSSIAASEAAQQALTAAAIAYTDAVFHPLNIAETTNIKFHQAQQQLLKTSLLLLKCRAVVAELNPEKALNAEKALLAAEAAANYVLNRPHNLAKRAKFYNKSVLAAQEAQHRADTAVQLSQWDSQEIRLAVQAAKVAAHKAAATAKIQVAIKAQAQHATALAKSATKFRFSQSALPKLSLAAKEANERVHIIANVLAMRENFKAKKALAADMLARKMAIFRQMKITQLLLAAKEAQELVDYYANDLIVTQRWSNEISCNDRIATTAARDAVSARDEATVAARDAAQYAFRLSDADATIVQIAVQMLVAFDPKDAKQFNDSSNQPIAVSLPEFDFVKLPSYGTVGSYSYRKQTQEALVAATVAYTAAEDALLHFASQKATPAEMVQVQRQALEAKITFLDSQAKVAELDARTAIFRDMEATKELRSSAKKLDYYLRLQAEMEVTAEATKEAMRINAPNAAYDAKKVHHPWRLTTEELLKFNAKMAADALDTNTRYTVEAVQENAKMELAAQEAAAVMLTTAHFNTQAKAALRKLLFTIYNVKLT